MGQVRRLDANRVLAEYAWDENQRLARIVYPSAPGMQLTCDTLDRPQEARWTSGLEPVDDRFAGIHRIAAS